MVDLLKDIIRKQKLSDEEIKTFAKNVLHTYVSFLSTLEGTEDYDRLKDSYDNCIALLRLSLCRALKIPYLDTIVLNEDLVDACSRYLLDRVNFNINIEKQAVNQICVLVANGIRRGIDAGR